MTEEQIRLERFTMRYVASYPKEIEYRRLNDNFCVRSSRDFQLGRARMMRDLLAKQKEEIGMPHALLSEFVLGLAVGPLISPFGYKVELAAQSIESGGVSQKGIDLLVVDSQKRIMMGIDVKLSEKRFEFNRNGGAWLDNLTAPYINLTLGNWNVTAKDKSVDNVKTWIIKCVLPNIIDGGKIPGLNSLRTFVVTRIKNSLEYQRERIDNNQSVTLNGLPWDRQRKIACRQKLNGLINMFGEIEKNFLGNSCFN